MSIILLIHLLIIKFLQIRQRLIPPMKQHAIPRFPLALKLTQIVINRFELHHHLDRRVFQLQPDWFFLGNYGIGIVFDSFKLHSELGEIPGILVGEILSGGVWGFDVHHLVLVLVDEVVGAFFAKDVVSDPEEGGLLGFLKHLLYVSLL